MKDGTKRSLRTAYASVVALTTAVPIVLADLPVGLVADSTAAQLATFAAWTVFVNKAINSLEDRHVIPAWLRDAPPAAE